MKKTAAVLLLIGLLQMAGDVMRLPALKGIGAATAISPAPKVFTVVRGMECYSTRFYLIWTDRRGNAHELLLTPELYSRIAGPYNRRNVYGAALAGGPVLMTDEMLAEMFRGVTNYALCGQAPLLRELGIDPEDVATMHVRYEPAPGTTMGELPRVLEVKCQ